MKHNNYFIDTGAYLAAFTQKDYHHTESLKIWEAIENSNINIVTTNHVLDELATLLARKTNYPFSVSKLEEIYANPEIRIERSTHEDELRALSFFKKYADQEISFTDCISFAIMERLKIQNVFTFDQHFKYFGFDLVITV